MVITIEMSTESIETQNNRMDVVNINIDIEQCHLYGEKIFFIYILVF